MVQAEGPTHPWHPGRRWSVVFDLGAVVFTWQPAVLLAEAFPDEAGQPLSAQALARQVFAHADWLAFDAGRCTLDAVVARTQARLGLWMAHGCGHCWFPSVGN